MGIPNYRFPKDRLMKISVRIFKIAVISMLHTTQQSEKIFPVKDIYEKHDAILLNWCSDR